MTRKRHINVICTQPEVADDVISGWNVKTIDGYLKVNIEVAISSNFWDIPQIILFWRWSE